MKRRAEDETVNLIGRSAAERSLDRFYNRQRSQLAKLSPKDEEEQPILSFNKVLPFPEVAKTEDVKPESQPKVKSEPVKKTLKEVLSDLKNKHIPNRKKFAKGVTLLSKLSNSYFKEAYGSEKGVSHSDFFEVFWTVSEVFVKEFSGTVPKDCHDEKEALVSLTRVIDYLLEYTPGTSNPNVKAETNVKKEQKDKSDHTSPSTDNSQAPEPRELFLTYQEFLFLRLLKVTFGYPSALWYENDPFAFHNVVNSLKKFFEEFLDETKAGFERSETTSFKTEPFELPSRDHLMSLQLKSFVRTLGVVFCFFDFPWSKSSLVPLFSLVYLKRDIFDDSDQTRISAWQSAINSRKSKSAKSISVQAIGESSFEVRDGREEKLTSVHGSQVWSDRQLRL